MLCDALMPQAWSPRHPSLSIFLQGGTLNDGAKDESNGQALEEGWGGGDTRRECRKEGERDSSREDRERHFSLSYFRQIRSQKHINWEMCGPVASLALGLEEQVVALVGGGEEFAKRTNMRLKRQQTGSQGHSFIKNGLSEKSLGWHAEHSVAQTGAPA